MIFAGKRYYCFFDRDLGVCDLCYTKQWPFFKKLHPLKTIKLPVGGQQLDSWFNQKLQKEIKAINRLRLGHQFWQLADQELKQALLLSIYLRKIHAQGVFNVFTKNWLSEQAFQKIYQEQKKCFSDFKPRKIFERLVRSAGFHRKSLRFDQVHLALDRVDGDHHYSIHYDLYNNNHLKKVGLLKHALFENGKNKFT